MTIKQITKLRQRIEEAILTDYPMGLSLPERLSLVEQRLRTLIENIDPADPIPTVKELITKKNE